VSPGGIARAFSQVDAAAAGLILGRSPMQHFAAASFLSVLLGRLSVHQDLLWFGTLVGWSLIIAFWLRHPQREKLAWWLPWFAGMGALGALVQFMVFNLPFDLFLEILLPGSNAVYEPPALDPFVTADILLAALGYGLVLAWWWERAASWSQRILWRSLGVGAWLILLAAHYAWPGFSSWLLAALLLVLALPPPNRAADRRPPLWLSLLPALVAAASTIGPVAWHLGLIQRSAAATPLGALAAMLQLGVAALLLAHLWRQRPRGAPDAETLRQLARPYFMVAAGLIVLGVGYALILGAEQRREVIENRLRATVHNARQLKPADFAAFTTPEFQLTDIQVAADSTGTARAPGFAPVMAAAARALADRVRATQFQKAAGFLVLHDGWLVEAAGTMPRPQPDSVILRGRATADDEAAWREKRLFVRYSPVPEQGAPYYCRAPLLGPDGRMLGWLESPREEFYASLARKWRTSPLLITALGVVLTVALYFQKRATLEREYAARTAAVEAEANRLKTAFLAKVSHELRTPIQSLLGYGELLQARLGDDAQARAWLGALQQHGEIMTRLINDLLDLSAAESGSFRLSPQPLEPDALVRRVVASLEPRAATKGLQLACTTTPAVPAWVEADGNRLAQVALNLVGNALKFTTAGAVTVTLDAVPEPADPARMRLVLTVRDTGPGITPEDQARLFEPFSRLERTAAHEGSGLGLALSAVLCRAMHGRLTVESDGLTGSSFRAELVAPTTTAPTALSVQRPVGSPPACVLVVDDNLLLRELFASYLRSRGCTCLTAASGAEALAHAQTGTPDAVVLDVSLPDADGIELAPRLRASLPRARLVGVSAHAGDTERERAGRAGLHEFHAKPVPLETLWHALCARPASPAAPAGYTVPPHLHAVFRRELPAFRAELAAAVARHDLPGTARRAHYLRSSALVVQKDELFAACTELETAATQARPVSATTAWQRCDLILARIL
jgi:signal transduction histidine kinase/CheY-like chemotaxis protein